MNVLVIGLGSIARKHLSALKQIAPEASIYALRSSAEAIPEPSVTSIFDLSKIPVQPDFVIISNPTHLHEQAIESCVDFGVPLFIEKPVISDLSKAEKLQELLQQHSIPTYVACNLRFHPVIEFVKQYMAKENPVINEVNVYCGSYLPEWRPGKDFRKVYSANKNMGGGAHLDLIHELDYTCWIWGMPAETIAIKRRVSSLQIDAIDTASYHLLYPKFTAHVTLNYFRRDAKREIEIVGESETITANLIKHTVTTNNGKELFRAEPDIKITYQNQLAYFIQQIRNKLPLMNDFNEAVETLKIALT